MDIEGLPRVEHQHGPGDLVAQLAHVARPVVASEGAHGRAGEPRRTRSAGRRLEGEELRGQQGHILAALAQGRQHQRSRRQPEVQVAAKAAVRHPSGQVHVGGGDEAHVGPERLATAHAIEARSLEHPQHFGLERERHVADLV